MRESVHEEKYLHSQLRNLSYPRFHVKCVALLIFYHAQYVFDLLPFFNLLQDPDDLFFTESDAFPVLLLDYQNFIFFTSPFSGITHFDYGNNVDFSGEKYRGFSLSYSIT